jgi:cytosine/adenosine deaminase-related metal-dependent hydrolase
MAFALRARVVFPVDRPPIEHGVVTVEGERIVAVGTQADARDVTDLGSVALLPGLVNCHTHLEFSHLRQPLGEPGMPFVDWIRLVVAERRRSGTPAADAVVKGLTESLRCGVTTIGEIMQGSKAAPTGEVAEAMLLTLLVEVIGFSRARTDSAYAAAVERLDALSIRPPTQVGISPHAPYSVSPLLFERLIGLAIGRDLLVATHLAESNEELQFLDARTGPFREFLEERSMWDAQAVPRGSRPMDYLRLLAKAPRALVVHGNYLDEEERSFLAANADRMSLVYCPRTHSYFHHPQYQLSQLLAAGVRVVLGTDSRASNPDLNLLAEMQHVARTFSVIDPHDILRMGTLTGAEALGREMEVGSITPGKVANLITVPLPEGATRTGDGMLEGLLVARNAVSAVWLRGTEIRVA